VKQKAVQAELMS